MKRSAESIVLFALAALILTGCAGSRIDGTYALVERRLPDGTVQTPPEIVGSAMIHDGVRTIVVNWKDDQGRNTTVASISQFALDQYSYTDTNVLYMTNEGGMLYEVGDDTATEEVVYTERGLRFKLPLHQADPVLEFSSDGFTATRDGEFIDHWKKVDVIRDEDRKAREAEERASREAAEKAEREAAEREAAEEAAATAEPEPQK